MVDEVLDNPKTEDSTVIVEANTVVFVNVTTAVPFTVMFGMVWSVDISVEEDGV